jgi:hypothetical protein
LKRREAALAALLAAVQAGLLADTAWDKSDLVDEPVYVTAAALLWHRGDFGFNLEAPVLPKWGFALALRLLDERFAELPPGPPDAVERHLLWSRDTDELRRTLFVARLPTLLVTVAAGLWLWRAGARLGPGVGLLSQWLWVFSPLILGSGGVARLDAWAGALVAFVALSAIRHFERPGLARALALGAAIGLAGACKAPALGTLPVALGVAAAARWKRRELRAFAADGALVLGGTFAALWAVYGFTVGSVDLSPLAQAWGDAWRGVRIGPLPFPAWITGLAEQIGHGARGHRKFLFGMTDVHGYWWFYLAVLALKTTLPAQALFVARAGSMFRRASRSSLAIDAALLAFPLLLLVVMSAGNTQHERYLLPIFPLALLWLGRSASELPRAFGGLGRGLALGLPAAAALAAVSLHPHHKMFFNTWAGGPEGGTRYLVTGEDEGQDQRRLGEWQHANRLASIYYTHYTGQPRAWGIRFQPPPCTAYWTPEDPAPRRGVFALHAIEVHRPRRIGGGCLDWLTVEPPDERIGYSIYVYRVDRARLERLRAKRWTETPFWRSGPAKPETPEG